MSSEIDYSGCRVLVTGAGGFIGSHLCEALVESGATVRALVHYNSRGEWGQLEHLPEDVKKAIEVVPGDVRDSGQVHKISRKCDVVFHLAALIGIPYSYVAPGSYVDTNIRGTLNVLEAARSLETPRVVVTSTSEVYGTALYTPMDEKHPLQAQSPYSASKIAADKLAESYHCSFQLPVVTLRPFNTYGPRQSARAVIPTIASQLVAGCEKLRLGSLEQVRDFTHVSDTARGFLLVGRAEKVVGQTINIGNGKGIKIKELAEKMMGILGKKIPTVTESRRVRPEHSEVQELVASTRRAQELINWKPGVSLEKGLESVLDYIAGHPSEYKVSSYMI